jgi:hypothetical protein
MNEPFSLLVPFHEVKPFKSNVDYEEVWTGERC